MSLPEILVDPRLLTAMLGYVPLSLALLYVGHALLERVEDVPVTGWLAEHAALPLLRILAMLGFLAMAYPVVFGLPELPPLGEVLGETPGRTMALVNAMFVVSVLLALIPLIGDIQALVLPVQGIAACGLLFQWAAPQRASLWPGWEVLAAVLVWATATYVLGSWLLHRAGTYVDGRWRASGNRALLLDTLMLVFQLPAILVYSLSLGRSLSPG